MPEKLIWLRVLRFWIKCAQKTDTDEGSIGYSILYCWLSTKKKGKNRSLFLHSNPLRSSELPVYLALRQQKVKVGALEQSEEAFDLLMYLQNEVVLED